MFIGETTIFVFQTVFIIFTDWKKEAIKVFVLLFFVDFLKLCSYGFEYRESGSM